MNTSEIELQLDAVETLCGGKTGDYNVVLTNLGKLKLDLGVYKIIVSPSRQRIKIFERVANISPILDAIIKEYELGYKDLDELGIDVDDKSASILYRCNITHEDLFGYITLAIDYKGMYKHNAEVS